MTTVEVSTLIDAMCTLLTECYPGPADARSTWFIDNRPDCGFLGVIKTVSAAEASISVDGSGQPGTTIAANAEHLRWSLASANNALRGNPYEGKWSESWTVLTVDEPAWDELRRQLGDEYEALLVNLKAQKDLRGEYLTGVLALIPHAAFHLGLIRQMVERIRKVATPRQG